MTGYGRGMAERDGRRAIVEIRSVNHRFLDLKLRGAWLEPSLEERVNSAVRSVCKRGSVTVSIRTERHGSAATLRVDLDAAKRVHGQLTGLARALGMDELVSLSLVCQQPGVMVAQEDEADAEVLAECVSQALTQALAGLATMRETEGHTLAQDLATRLGRLEQIVEEVSSLSAGAADETYRRIEERLARLLDTRQIALDESRLAQEVAILAERMDVTEELVRLRSHIEQVGQIMAEAKGPVGRRLDFLVQELGRELNTVTSKSQSAAIAGAVVEAKAELEKIREQVQNIE